MTLVYINNDASSEGVALVDGDVALAARRMRLTEPGGQGGVAVPGPSERLGRRVLDSGEQAAVWWLGAHGGAGESTFEELFSGSCAAEHSWPLSRAGAPPAGVVLLARTHARGLRAAQSAIREWAAGEVSVRLLGLLLVADAPGRLPHSLRLLAEVVAGGVPAVWQVPWVEAWRVGELPSAHNAPMVVRRLLEDLKAATGPRPALDSNVKRRE
jgi:hypothetical protein